MRFPLFFSVAIFVSSQAFGQDTTPESQSVALATHQVEAKADLEERREVERIRQIVLHQGNNPQALANLVQLTRKLDDTASAQLCLELAAHYLEQAEYNRAADFLQQLVNQYPTEPAASAGLLQLTQLYSSSEVNHTHQTPSPSGLPGYCRYALYVADDAIAKHTTLNNDPAITFQKAVAAHGAGQVQLATGLLTKLKHVRTAQPWRTYAQVEHWLQDGREGECPLPALVCRRTEQRPHLDGVLHEPMWQEDEKLQLVYDDQFLYLAAHYPKHPGQQYPNNKLPRTYDADLSGHDHVRIRLDADRDYATHYELAVDHRGQTADRCWLDTSWNPKWFVAASADDTHWTCEAAIGWDQLTSTPPTAGSAWAIAIVHTLPDPATAASADTTSSNSNFLPLLFE